MSNYSSLKATINANVKTNGNQEITGAVMNSVLNAMVNSLGAGYQYKGIATPTSPGSAQTPDYKCFYLATTPGTYTNLGGLVVADGEVAILKYDTSWTKEVTGIATAESVSQLGQQVNDELFDYNKGSQLSIVSEESGKGLNADGTLFSNGDFITCSYDVVEGNSYYITGRQPGAGTAVACAYDSNGNFVRAYTYTPSTNIEDALITIPAGASILKVCATGIIANPNRRPSVYNATKSSRINALEETTESLSKVEESIYNKQLLNIFLTGGGKFHVEETRVSGGNVYFSYTDGCNLQYFTKLGSTQNIGEFDNVVSASGLVPVTSPEGVTCISIPASKVLIINLSNKFEIKNFSSLISTDIVLLYNVAGRVSLAIDEILIDMPNHYCDKKIAEINSEIAVITPEINTINEELFDYNKGTRLSIVSEETQRGLNADGTLFSNGDFITCSYDVVEGNTYYITGRQPGAGTAVACAYDSNGNFVLAYTYTPSTNIEDALISIPAGASVLKVCISGIIANPNRRPSVFNAVFTSRIDALGGEVEAIEETLSQGEIPSYWQTLLETKESSILNKMKSVGYNGDSFVFITDIHWGQFNFGKSPILIKHILDNTCISNIFVGGDVSQNGTIPETMGFVSNVRKFTDRIFATPGNHDVTLSQFYSIFGKLAENYTDTGKSTDFYLDNDSQKIRYIFLSTPDGNTPLSQNQETFLNNCVSSLGTDWTIFVITHIIWHAAVVTEDPQITICGQSVMDAVDAAAELTDATIGAIICGHLHRDWDGQTDGGIIVIGTTCDANGSQAAYDPVTPTRQSGTTSEQVFDVFTIDTFNKTINTYRIGGNGSDREFSYATI